MIELARFFLGIALLLVAYLLACGINGLIEAALGCYRARKQRQIFSRPDGAQGDPATDRCSHETKGDQPSPSLRLAGPVAMDPVPAGLTPLPASCSGLLPGRDESRSLRSGSAAGPVQVHLSGAGAQKGGL